MPKRVPSPELLRTVEALRAQDARVAIAGVSGAGKSTLARHLSSALDLPYTELDALHWGADWTPRPSFTDDVFELVAHERWVTEWQYREVRHQILERATVMIWLDPPFRTTLWRVISRTFRRRLRREELWNGNQEPGIRHAILHREGIIRWAVSTRDKYRNLVEGAMRTRPDLVVLHVGRTREIRALLAAVSTTQD